jgi:hypothetical protein
MASDTQTNELIRRIMFAVLSAILGYLATRLALYITNKVLGDPSTRLTD